MLTEKEKAKPKRFKTYEYLHICVITNPYRHGLVVGSTGCGKTVSVVEPYLRETLRSGHAKAVYDYKSQAPEGHLHFEASWARPRAGRLMPAIRTLNMVGARHSHRFDLLSTIRTPLHAQELAGAIITGGRTHRDSSDFFNQAATGYLSSILYYYAVKYAGPQPVTLPHVFAILLAHETEDIRRYYKTLETDTQSKMLLSTVRYSRGASEQMAGILATLKNNLTPLVSRDVFFTLSGRESLVMNDPGSPRVLVLSSGEEVRQARSPLTSTVLETLMRLMSKPGQYPRVFCDNGLASMYIPCLTDFLSTARSNRIAASLDFGISANGEERYGGRAPPDTILANCLRQIYGMNTKGGPGGKAAGMFGTCERSYQTTGRSGSRGWLGPTRAQQSVSDQVDLRHPRIGDTTDVKGLSPGSFYSIHPRKRQGPERAQAYPMIRATTSTFRPCTPWAKWRRPTGRFCGRRKGPSSGEKGGKSMGIPILS